MIKTNKILTNSLALVFAVTLLLTNSSDINASADKAILIKGKDFKIVFSDEESGPLKIALKAFRKDFERVMGADPAVVNEMDGNKSQPEIVIVNRTSGFISIPSGKIRKLDGFESHRIYADAENNRIYIEGYDLRGTIFGIYTFSEEFLGVPPLHYWSSWVPDKKGEISVSADCDIFFKSPQVRYRSILPGDQDFFNPWKKKIN